MTKTVIHTDDLPSWAVRKQKLPHSYLGFLKEAVLPSPDGKGTISIEDVMLRQHWDGMLIGSAKARDWLLREIIKDNQAALEASPERPSVIIEGVDYFQPLGPVMALLGCATVNEPEDGSEEPPLVELSPWFLDGLKRHCPAQKLAPVLAWLDAGGKQQPRIRDRDRHD